MCTMVLYTRPFRTFHKQIYTSCKDWLSVKLKSDSSRLLVSPQSSMLVPSVSISSQLIYLEPSAKQRNILFFGTDEFALTCLESLHVMKKLKLVNIDVVSLLLKNEDCAVVKYAKKHSLQLQYWPVTVPSAKYDLGIVVSFGHLIPSRIISAFSLGMINVHASLLPRWRGCAPVIHAILNGDGETGITIMKIEPKHFDTGSILAVDSVLIDPHITGKDLASKLSVVGSTLLTECLLDLPNVLKNASTQTQEGITHAPKVTQATAKVLWREKSALNVYNQYRALCGIYKLWSFFQNQKVRFSKALSPESTVEMKLETLTPSDVLPGFVYFHKKRKLVCVKCLEGWIAFQRIQVEGKPEMSATDFYNGFLSKVKSHETYFSSEK